MTGAVGASSSKILVLVVEDEFMNQKMMKRVLSDEEAQETYDFLILDFLRNLS